MFTSKNFSAAPVLADALEEASCDNSDILEHCRGTGPHVRGCWVVDGILLAEETTAESPSDSKGKLQ
jgi:hypothetical protein